MDGVYPTKTVWLKLCFFPEARFHNYSQCETMLAQEEYLSSKSRPWHGIDLTISGAHHYLCAQGLLTNDS